MPLSTAILYNMYQIAHKDEVVSLEEAPQSSVGSPRPMVFANENNVVLSYYTQEKEFWQDSPPPQHVTPFESNALITLKQCRVHMFGSPNDEAFSGHPLANRGLAPYGAFRIEHSSWIRQLEQMNSVHPLHRPERFAELMHLIFSFHDSTFECVCKTWDMATIREDRQHIIQHALALLKKA
jgi:hypothetical protein